MPLLLVFGLACTAVGVGLEFGGDGLIILGVAAVLMDLLVAGLG